MERLDDKRPVRTRPWLSSRRPTFPVDVVVSEIDIPGSTDGFGFAQWARSVRPELKILLAGTPERAVRNAAEPCEVGPTLKVRCRLHGGASGSGGPPGERNGQYRHGERTKGAIAERQKFSALLKMLRSGLM